MVLFGLLLLPLLLGMAMRKVINHDEHQFIAAGVLIARQGLVPFLDFPYFHLPGLSYLYAGAFLWSDRLLLTARGLAVGAAWLMLLLLLVAPLGLFQRQQRIPSGATGAPQKRGSTLNWTRWAGVLIVLLLISTQTFRYTMGWAWNHDVPVLLLCVAVWVQLRLAIAHRPGSPPLYAYLLIGLLMGLATAMRASFALPALVFALFALPPLQISLSASATAKPEPGWRAGLLRRLGQPAAWRPILWLGVGGLIGSLPGWVFFPIAPAQFLFGNFEYVRLNTAHYLETGGLAPGEGWRQKWEMTRDTLITVWRANFALVLLSVVQTVRVVYMNRGRAMPGLGFLGVLIPAALVSGYAPTPMQVQYIYLAFPLLALLNLALLAYDPMPRLGMGLLLVAALYGASQAGADFRDSWAAAWQPGTWVPVQVHAHGQQIARLVENNRTWQAAPAFSQALHDGPIITLAPIYALEGGAQIRPELVSGPFGWRVANLVAPSVRRAMDIVGPDELLPEMAGHPPQALLVGIHGAHAPLEPPLNEFAQTFGYVPIAIPGFASEPGTLWLAPVWSWRDPDDPRPIHLGAGGYRLLPEPGASLVGEVAAGHDAPALRIEIELYLAAEATGHEAASDKSLDLTPHLGIAIVPASRVQGAGLETGAQTGFAAETLADAVPVGTLQIPFPPEWHSEQGYSERGLHLQETFTLPPEWDFSDSEIVVGRIDRPTGRPLGQWVVLPPLSR